MERWCKVNKQRLAIVLSLLALICFSSGFVLNYHLPRIKELILTTLTVRSQKALPLLFKAQSLDIQWVPFQIRLNEVLLTPKTEMKLDLSPVSIRSIEIRPSWLDLFIGDFRLAKVIIDGPSASYFVEPQFLSDFSSSEQTNEERSKKKFDFSDLKSLPFDDLEIKDLSLHLKIKQDTKALKITNLNLLIENKYESFLVRLNAPQNQFTHFGENGLIEFGFETRFLLDESSINISALKLLSAESYLISSGRFNLNSTEFTIESGQVNARLKTKLKQVPEILKTLKVAKNLPEMGGFVEADAGILFNSGAAPQVDTVVKFTELQVERFFLGKVELEATINDRFARLKELIIQNEAGLARVTDFQIDLENEKKFLGKAFVEQLEVGQLLKLFQIKTPLLLSVSGSSVCEGQLVPVFRAECRPEINGEQLKVWSPSTEKIIVELRDLSAGGSVQFSTEGLTFTTDLVLGKSSEGQSSGKIIFNNGFDISFANSKLNFADVTNLADLNLEGSAELRAVTKGNSKGATFSIEAEAVDFFIKDYFLNQLSSSISYQSGQLFIDQLNGSIDSTRYEGFVRLDFIKNSLELSARLPLVDLAHLKRVIDRPLPLPFEIYGSGEGQIKAWGPLNISELNFDLKSRFYRGSIYGEAFDDLTVNLVSTDGLMTPTLLSMRKGDGLMSVNGSLSIAGKANLTAEIQKLRIEQVDYLSKLGLDLNGNINLQMSLIGQIPNVDFAVTGQTEQMMSNTIETGESQFKVKVNPEQLSLYGNFFGSQLWTDITYPFSGSKPFAFKAKSREWDYTRIFQIFSKNLRSKDFATQITADIDLESPSGDFEDLVGFVEIDQFNLRRGEIELKNILPMTAELTSTHLKLSQFELLGPQSFLNLNLKNGLRDNIFIDLSARLDLTLFAIFTPFLQDLRGSLTASTQIRGPLFDPSVLGSAFIEKAFVAIEQFPHPIENLRADFIFSPENLLINSINAQVAKGRLTGDGQIKFKGSGLIPVDIQTQFKDVQLKFPEGFETQGSGNLNVTGDFFPYTMKVEYEIEKSLVTMELSGSKAKPDDNMSPYLPLFLAEDIFKPVIFDLDLKLQKPALIKNSMAKIEVSGGINIKGPPDQLQFTGTMTPLPGGQIIFRENNFEIVSAFVEYKKDPPDNPSNIYLSAKARVTEIIPTENREIRNDYDVNVLIQGEAKDPKISLDSSPALSEREIVSLLALGITTATTLDQNLTRGDQQTGAAPGVIGSQVGAQLFQTGLGQEFKQRLGVEVKVGSAFNIAENASFPRVTFVKQWDPKFETSASRTIEPNPISDVRAEYRLNSSTSAIGFWEARQENISQDFRQRDSSRLGVDLEYRIEFK